MKIGFLINPIAGLGGKVALKGTDNIAKQARELGAKPVSIERARFFLKHLISLHSSILEKIEILTPPEEMGYSVLHEFKIKTTLLQQEMDSDTNAKNTEKAIQDFEENNVDLIVFVGGDGTSVDIFKALKKKTPILGIPSGVKTYGAVFAHSPEEVISIIELYFENKSIKDAEILDLDEDLYRKGILSTRIFGYAKIPSFPEYFQHSKERIQYNEDENETLNRLTEEIIEVIHTFQDNTLVIIGPGSTFTLLGETLHLNKTLLGVDCFGYTNKKLSILVNDGREDQILELLGKFSEKKILLTPIGGLGYLLGRGNHQISASVIKKVRKEDIIVVSTNQKLNTIKDNVLRVDIYNGDSNSKLLGYIKVITDRNEMRMMKVIH